VAGRLASETRATMMRAPSASNNDASTERARNRVRLQQALKTLRPVRAAARNSVVQCLPAEWFHQRVVKPFRIRKIPRACPVDRSASCYRTDRDKLRLFPAPESRWLARRIFWLHAVDQSMHTSFRMAIFESWSSLLHCFGHAGFWQARLRPVNRRRP